jgi:hypothetical protein
MACSAWSSGGWRAHASAQSRALGVGSTRHPYMTPGNLQPGLQVCYPPRSPAPPDAGFLLPCVASECRRLSAAVPGPRRRPHLARPASHRYQRGPSMVARGEWDPKEDKALVKALLEGGAAREHAVDWGALVAGRGEAQVGREGGGEGRGPRRGARGPYGRRLGVAGAADVTDVTDVMDVTGVTDVTDVTDVASVTDVTGVADVINLTRRGAVQQAAGPRRPCFGRPITPGWFCPESQPSALWFKAPLSKPV